MTRALATMQDKVTSVKQLLHQHSKSLVAALPKQIGVERFSRIVMTSVTLTPGLLDCSPNSLLSAVLTCAQLGLEPDGVRNMAHLVPFGKKVTFIPGYMGLMDLSMRSGKFRNIEAHIVYVQDEFDYAHGSSPFISHKPAYEKADRGEQIAAYCIAFFRDGGFQFRVMPMNEIRKIRDRSPAGRSGPWVTDFDAMALKTIIRHTVKYLPSAVVDQALSLAVGLDERAEAGIDQQLEVISGIDTTTGEIIEEPGKSALDELADKHGAPSAAPPDPKLVETPKAPEDTVSAEDRAFIDRFKGLHKSGFTKFLRSDEVQVELALLPPDSPVWKAIDEKHQRFWGGPCPRPSLASPLPTGPSAEPPTEPPAGPPGPEVTEPPEMPPAPPEEGQEPLFGQGLEPEELMPPAGNAADNLASIERTLEIDKFVKTYGINLKQFHDWAITTKRMIMGRYTGYFSHCYATDPDTEMAAFGASQES